MDRIIEIFNEDEEFRKHFDEWNFFDFKLNKKIEKPGQFFLYESFEDISNGRFINYPRLSIFLNHIPCDQTVEIECVDVVRTVDINRNNNHSSTISYYIQWSDFLLVYGIWDSYPTWKELRLAYDRTWFFHKNKSEKRNLKINQILNA